MESIWSRFVINLATNICGKKEGGAAGRGTAGATRERSEFRQARRLRDIW